MYNYTLILNQKNKLISKLTAAKNENSEVKVAELTNKLAVLNLDIAVIQAKIDELEANLSAFSTAKLNDSLQDKPENYVTAKPKQRPA